ncbi:hypothetical protein DSO57_1034794 [Entomophthora muscae]|uniref:Uncharacterized protein n=1 Tax=Entomophthora muscae TaxID=34485 RepID=A0ACC2REM1_9FUNG|nr:hypothetical protein DSO57_1034794 [Entomophthora muscae]
MPSGPRAFQENRNKPSFSDKPKTSESSITQGTAGTNSNQTCYKSGKLGHMSRELKQPATKYLPSLHPLPSHLKTQVLLAVPPT